MTRTSRTGRTGRTGRKRRSANRRRETNRPRETDRQRDATQSREGDRSGGASRRRELERRIDRLETEVAWLARVVRDAGERDDALATGPCPNCSRGVLVQRNGELRCGTCEFSRFL